MIKIVEDYFSVKVVDCVIVAFLLSLTFLGVVITLFFFHSIRTLITM